MKTKLVSAIVIFAGMSVAGIVFAQTGGPVQAGGSNVQYPVAALGNCGSKDACKAYCNDPSHVNACLAFAEENNLMSPGEIAAAKKFIAAGSVGPGGCTAPEACKAYCNDTSHINECVAFAEKTGILPPAELAEAKKVQAAIARGIQPPPCGGKDTCNTYCSEPSHREACVTFAEAAGMMTPEEAQNADKMLAAIKKGVNPPPCNGPDECNAYCALPDHVDECTAFAVAAGMMTPQEAEMARKTGGKGPGGCTSKDQCDAFCKDPNNREICFNFAKDNGMISPAELEQTEQAQKQNEQALTNAPAAVVNCLNAALGNGIVGQIQSGQAIPSEDIGNAMNRCFSENRPQGPQFVSGTMPMGPAGQRMPGGPEFASGTGPGMMPPGGGGFPAGTAPGQGFASGTAPNMTPSPGGEFPQGPGPEFASGTFPNMPQPPQGQVTCQPNTPCNQGPNGQNPVPPCPAGQNCGYPQQYQQYQEPLPVNNFATGTGPVLPPPPATSSPSSFVGSPGQASLLNIFESFAQSLGGVSSGR